MDAHGRLIEALRAHALVLGEVTLTSGADGAVLRRRQAGDPAARGLSRRSASCSPSARAQWGATAVGGMTMGADAGRLRRAGRRRRRQGLLRAQGGQGARPRAPHRGPAAHAPTTAASSSRTSSARAARRSRRSRRCRRPGTRSAASSACSTACSAAASGSRPRPARPTSRSSRSTTSTRSAPTAEAPAAACGRSSTRGSFATQGSTGAVADLDREPAGHPRTEGGPFVARKRPTASDVTTPALICIDGGMPDFAPPKLTRAESQALRRSAPLTHSQLRAHLDPPGLPPAIRPTPRPPLRGL